MRTEMQGVSKFGQGEVEIGQNIADVLYKIDLIPYMVMSRDQVSFRR